MIGSKLRLATVKKERLTTRAGWKIVRKEDEMTDRVTLKIIRPDGLLRLKLNMTKKEWDQLSR